MLIAEWSPLLTPTNKPFIVFSLHCTTEDSDRAALVGIWCPVRVSPPHRHKRKTELKQILTFPSLLSFIMPTAEPFLLILQMLWPGIPNTEGLESFSYLQLYSDTWRHRHSAPQPISPNWSSVMTTGVICNHWSQLAESRELLYGPANVILAALLCTRFHLALGVLGPVPGSGPARPGPMMAEFDAGAGRKAAPLSCLRLCKGRAWGRAVTIRGQRQESPSAWRGLRQACQIALRSAARPRPTRPRPSQAPWRGQHPVPASLLQPQQPKAAWRRCQMLVGA